MTLDKDIRDLTAEQVEELAAQMAPEVKVKTYRVEGSGGWPGKWLVPARCWYRLQVSPLKDLAWQVDDSEPWRYTENGKTFEEWVNAGDRRAFVLTQSKDGELILIDDRLEEDG